MKAARAFTLVELLVVISIIGVLASIALVSFRNSQARSRDTQRKSNLKEMKSALELYYSDYGKYPSSSNGQIAACPYNPTTGIGVSCAWGSGEFTDGVRVYFKIMPQDPSDGTHYYYRVVDPGTNDKYQIFAGLENTQDANCIDKNCTDPSLPSGVSCGTLRCNFAVTSTNASSSE